MPRKKRDDHEADRGHLQRCLSASPRPPLQEVIALMAAMRRASEALDRYAAGGLAERLLSRLLVGAMGGLMDYAAEFDPQVRAMRDGR